MEDLVRGMAAAPVGVGAMPDRDDDVRVSPVEWRGEERYVPFREAVVRMSHHRFRGDYLEGDLSGLECLRDVAQCSLTPTSRSRNWSIGVLLNQADRASHEHFVLSKIIEVASKVDQLNVPTVASV